MVVRYTEAGWEIVTQRAHGIIASQLAFHWNPGQQPQRWVETILAIAEHDDAENELDGEQLLTASGGPLNFDMKSFDLAHCKKLVSLTITKSRYIALLTSMHMEFLYGCGRENTKEASAFLKDQKKARAGWLKELHLTEATANRIYDLVEWCDALSLLICTGVMQPLQRTVEISRGPDKKMYYLTKVDNDTLSIDPWPFGMAEFSINYDYRVLETIAFSSSGDLRKQFLAARVLEKVWTLKKKGNSKAPPGKRSKLVKG